MEDHTVTEDQTAQEALPLNIRFPVSFFDGQPSITLTAILSDADARRLAAVESRKARIFGDLMLMIQDAVKIELRDQL